MSHRCAKSKDSCGLVFPLTLSEQVLPNLFRGGPGRLRSPDEAQHVHELVTNKLVIVPSQNLAPGSVVRGSDALSRSPFGGSHTHKSLPHKPDRSPVAFSR